MNFQESCNNEDDAAVPTTSIQSDRDLRYVREDSSKGNINNDMDEGSNRSPRNSLGDDYVCMDLLDRKICISCNEGGEVLVCTEGDCPVTLHARCLCIEPKFDDKGNFYCPYCWYKRALTEAQESRKKAFLAKKDLSKFFCQNGITSDKLAENDVEVKRKELFSVVGNGGGSNHYNGPGNDSLHNQPLKTVRDQQKEMERVMANADQHEVPVEDEAHANGQGANTGDSRHCREEKTPVHIELVHKSGNREKFDVHDHNISKTHETRFVERKEGIEPVDLRYNNEYVHARIVKDAKPLSAFCFGEYAYGPSPDIAFAKGTQESVEVCIDKKGKVKDREKLVQNELKVSATDCSVSKTNVSESEPLSMKECRVKQWAQRRAYSQRVPSVRKSLPLKSNIEGKSACYKNEEVATSKALGLPQRSSMRSKKLTLQTRKRKRLNWTVEEENTLKEGVLRFSMEQRNIPWKKILEFGCHVFDSNRTPADLKDKWKNMRV